MYKQFYCVIVCGLILAGCSKKEKGNDTPKEKEEVILIEKIESPQRIIRFEYNDKNFVTKVTLATKEEGGVVNTYGYAEYIYENGIPAYANYHNHKGNNIYELVRKTKYVRDASQKIVYTANINYWEDGQKTTKDSMDLTFNDKGQVTGMQFKDPNQRYEIKWAITENGNYNENPIREEHRTYNSIKTNEYSYNNKINPYQYNGLGLLLYTVFMEDIDNRYALFSVNHCIYSKYNNTTEEKGRDGQITSSTGSNEIYERTFEYDTAGLLTSSTVKSTWQSLENGAVTHTESEPFVHRTFTCVKKIQ